MAEYIDRQTAIHALRKQMDYFCCPHTLNAESVYFAARGYQTERDIEILKLIPTVNYCPWCGAQMRQEAEDAEE